MAIVVPVIVVGTVPHVDWGERKREGKTEKRGRAAPGKCGRSVAFKLSGRNSKRGRERDKEKKENIHREYNEESTQS